MGKPGIDEITVQVTIDVPQGQPFNYFEVGHDAGPSVGTVWAQSLSGTDRSAALGAWVQNSLQANPQQAQELYSKFAGSLDPEAAGTAENTRVARSVASTLTENDPQQAIVWASSLPSGGAQNEALAGIAEKWAGYDPVTASEWVSTLPPGEGRDFAADRLVRSIARDDPNSAWAWGTSIGDVAKRREAAARVLQAWKGYRQGRPSSNRPRRRRVFRRRREGIVQEVGVRRGCIERQFSGQNPTNELSIREDIILQARRICPTLELRVLRIPAPACRRSLDLWRA